MLILSRDTYFILAKEAARKEISLGKFLNNICNQAAKDIKDGTFDSEDSKQPICRKCGAPATRLEFVGDETVYVCKEHYHSKTLIDGFRDL